MLASFWGQLPHLPCKQGWKQHQRGNQQPTTNCGLLGGTERACTLRTFAARAFKLREDWIDRR
jgi:hypothetical protein